MQKKGTVLLSSRLAWPGEAGQKLSFNLAPFLLPNLVGTLFPFLPETGLEVFEEHSNVAHSAKTERHGQEEDEEERHLPGAHEGVDVVTRVLLEHVRLQLGQVSGHWELKEE